MVEMNMKMSRVRADARDRAERLIVEFSRLMMFALGGETLRGMPNLNPPEDDLHEKFHAMHVRKRFDAMLEHDPSLVITRRGAIVFAQVVDGPDGVRRVVMDGEVSGRLIAEDLASVANAWNRAIDRHLVRVDATTANYQKTIDLSKRLGAALGVSGFDG
jgi:hypothetical protein